MPCYRFAQLLESLRALTASLGKRTAQFRSFVSLPAAAFEEPLSVWLMVLD